ncbi:MAG TPA: ribulose-phosphate 3-epimerase [Bacteroidetes bacterium]|nr:ribulose-phosphate 3-epimerase [Bacteroidota bacterium]
MNHLVAPSLLAADFGKLNEEIDMINRSEADWLHLDIMDGVFVPNISFGFPVLETVSQRVRKPMDAHLMMVHPEKYLERFAGLGIYNLTVHYETCPHLHRTVQQIKELGMKAGVTLNPHNPVHLLEDILPEVDMVLVMSVNPGYGGQHFILHTYEKIRKLRSMIEKAGLQTLIEVDGGVDLDNKNDLLIAGVDVLVAGVTVFHSPNPPDTIRKLKE